MISRHAFRCWSFLAGPHQCEGRFQAYGRETSGGSVGLGLPEESARAALLPQGDRSSCDVGHDECPSPGRASSSSEHGFLGDGNICARNVGELLGATDYVNNWSGHLRPRANHSKLGVMFQIDEEHEVLAQRSSESRHVSVPASGMDFHASRCSAAQSCARGRARAALHRVRRILWTPPCLSGGGDGFSSSWWCPEP